MPVAVRVALVVTEVFAPAVLATVMLLVVGWHAYGNTLAGLVWGMAAALFASVIPFAVILRGVRSGALTDHHVGRREQRRTPMLIGLGCVIVGLAGLIALGAARELLAALATVFCGGLVSLAISQWWKMSVHTAVAATVVVVLTLVYGPLVLVTSPLVLVVAWSRVRLGDHTVAQTVVGAIIGVLVALVFGALR